MPETPTLLRNRDGEAENPVGFAELFFDLVFVFAVTQLSHRLLDHLTLLGALETLILFLAVWWTWIYTSWVTNWLDPERPTVRVMLFVVMLLGLILASAIPDAFEKSGAVFAVLYVAIQIGRSGFMIAALAQAKERRNMANFTRLTAWLCAATPFWLIGGFGDPETRIYWWALAIAIDYAGPAFNFAVPRLGRTATHDWDISGSHLSERCALFIIIALGEAIIIMGASYADGPRDAATTAALVVSFVGSAAMWWIYFDVGAKVASKKIDEAENPGHLARYAYTYLHLLIVAGIIVTAVADEKTLDRPGGTSSIELVSVAAAGPALFLTGMLAFKWATVASRRLPRSHLIGLGLLVFLPFGAGVLTPLAINALAAASLVAVCFFERVFRSEPTAHAEDPSFVVEVET